MKKGISILLILLMTTIVGCGQSKENNKSEGKSEVEVKVPTEKPVETQTPTAVPEEKEEPEQSPQADASSILDYFRISLKQEYAMLVDDKNQVVTIAKQGRKVGRITVHKDYRGKREPKDLVKDLLLKEGYVKAVRTLEKETYQMSKIMMETGLTEQDIKSGKLFSGNEEFFYLCYRDETPTTVLVFEVTDPTLEAAMDKMAATIELIK